jgi:O-methyltransferase
MGVLQSPKRFPSPLRVLFFIKKSIKAFFSLFNLEIRRNVLNEKILFSSDSTEFERQTILLAKKYTMTSYERLLALTYANNYVRTKKIPGSFVECGVWKGGNLLLLSLLNRHYGENREIYGFDTFTGMTNPTEYDQDIWGNSAEDLLRNSIYKDGKPSLYCFASLNLVKTILKENDCLNIKLIVGDVQDTLLVPQNLPASISILRLDTDWYESTRIELEILYPLLEPGGVLIIDDYGCWSGSRKAVDEYFEGKNPFIFPVDNECRIIIKEK